MKVREPHISSGKSDLQPLVEFSTLISGSLNLNFILNSLLLTLFGKLAVSRGLILIRNEVDRFEIAVSKGIEKEYLGRTIKIKDLTDDLVDLRGHATSVTAFQRFCIRESLSWQMPIFSNQSVKGYLFLGDKFTKAKYSAEDREVMRSLLNMSSSSIANAIMVRQLHDAHRDLDRKYQELNTLFDLGKELSALLDPAQILKLLSYSLMGQVGVRRYALFLRENDQLKPMLSKTLEKIPIECIQPLCDINVPTYLSNIARKHRYSAAVKTLRQLGLEVVIPMQTNNVMRGLLFAGQKQIRNEFSQADLEYLFSLGNLAVTAIENARLFATAIEKQKMEDEMQIAQEIQMGLLPRTLPEIKDLDIFAVSKASKIVGGDYYDVIIRPSGKVLLAVGDVSGKGMPAALLMSNVQAALRTLASIDIGIIDIIHRLNSLIFSNAGLGRFITFFLCEYDPIRMELHYINAGHNPPLYLNSRQELRWLEKGGLLLGIMEKVPSYEMEKVVISTGDLIVLFTDGISEATAENEEQFGETRIVEISKENHKHASKVIGREILKSVETFASDSIMVDDQTLVVMKKL